MKMNMILLFITYPYCLFNLKNFYYHVEGNNPNNPSLFELLTRKIIINFLFYFIHFLIRKKILFIILFYFLEKNLRNRIFLFFLTLNVCHIPCTEEKLPTQALETSAHKRNYLNHLLIN